MTEKDLNTFARFVYGWVGIASAAVASGIVLGIAGHGSVFSAGYIICAFGIFMGIVGLGLLAMLWYEESISGASVPSTTETAVQAVATTCPSATVSDDLSRAIVATNARCRRCRRVYPCVSEFHYQWLCARHWREARDRQHHHRPTEEEP